MQRHSVCGTRHEPSLLCPCHSPTLRPWIAGRRRARQRDDVFVEGLWSPRLTHSLEIHRQKHTLMPKRNSSAERMSSLSLSGGASIRSRAFKLSITFLSNVVGCLQNDEGDPLGSPSTGFAMRLED
jgi:hypothetical protein